LLIILSIQKKEIRARWLLLFQAFVLFFLLSGKAVNAGEVVAILESHQWPYEKALEGIVEECFCTPEVYYLKEIPSVISFKKKIATLKPRLLVAVGSKALEYILSNKFSLPVVYAMVLNPWSKIPQMYWEAMVHIKPAIKTVGLLYNPLVTQILKDHAEKLAKEAGQELIAIPVRNPKESLQAIKNMASLIDAFLMLPDKTLIRQEIIDTLVSSSLKKRFVLIGLSGKYVKAGALMAYSFNSKANGKSTGKIVKTLLSNSLQMNHNSKWAPETELAINLKTANKIGVVIDASLLEKADIIIK
jgi:putative ABC transport system substrate-binding protein